MPCQRILAPVTGAGPPHTAEAATGRHFSMRDNPSSRWWTSGWNSTTPPGRCSLPAPDQTPSPGPGAGRSSAAYSRPPYGPMVPAPVDDAGTDQVTRTHPRDHHPSIRPGGVTGSLRRGGMKVAVPQLQPLRAGAPQGEQSRSRTGIRTGCGTALSRQRYKPYHAYTSHNHQA
jgi:hypothetical protein